MSTDFIMILKKLISALVRHFKGRPLVEQFPSLAFPVSSLTDWLRSILLRSCDLVNGSPLWWEMIFCGNCNNFALVLSLMDFLLAGSWQASYVVSIVRSFL